MFRENVRVLLVALALAGCATDIPAEVLANADYGPPPPENYQEMVKAEISQRLIDPTSGIFEISEPREGYTKASSLWGTEQAFGWRVCGTVNSKNRFGGYVGRVPFFALFEDEKITQLLLGKITTNRHGFNALNPAILNACER